MAPCIPTSGPNLGLVFSGPNSALTADRLDRGQMVYDFGLLKNQVKCFLDGFDHATLGESAAPLPGQPKAGSVRGAGREQHLSTQLEQMIE